MISYLITIFILYGSIAVIGFIIYKTILGPFILTTGIKKKYKQQVEVIFSPVLGLYSEFRRCLNNNKQPFYFINEMVEKNPNMKAIYSCGIKGRELWLIMDPELMKVTLQNPDYYQKSERILFNQKQTFGQGLFFSEREQWKIQRNMISDAFHFQSLKSYTPMINTITKQTMEEYIKLNQPNNIITTCSLIAGNVVSSSFFGQQFTESQFKGKNINKEIQEVISEAAYLQRTFTAMLKSLFIHPNYGKYDFLLNKSELSQKKRYKELLDFCQNYVNEQIKENKDVNAQKTFLDILITEFKKGKITIPTIVENFIGFFFAGIDTTGNFSGMSCYQLALDQELQQRLYNDILSYFRSTRENFNPQQDFEVYHDDINKITSLNNFVKEGFRFYNPAGGIVQRKVTKDHKIGDFHIKKGEYLSVNSSMTVIDPNTFSNPDQFNIDRWNSSEIKKMDPYMYIPFSSGPRNCIGQHLSLIETKIMLIQFLMKYKMLENKKVQLKYTVKLTITPLYEDLVIFEKRL